MRLRRSGTLRRGGWAIETTDMEQAERIWSDVMDQHEYSRKIDASCCAAAGSAKSPEINRGAIARRIRPR